MGGLLEMLIARTMLAAAWFGPWLLLALLPAAWLTGRWLARSKDDDRARPWWHRPVDVILIAVQVFVVAGLIMTFGPGKPIIAEMRLLHRQVGEPMPELGFRRVVDDAEASLNELQGQVVLLNVWATWCPPCRKEMPALNDIQRRLGDRGLLVAALSDESREVLQGFLAEHPADVLHLYNPALPPYLATSMRPKTLLIDREGVLREFVIGAHDEAFFVRLVEPYLAEST